MSKRTIYIVVAVAVAAVVLGGVLIAMPKKTVAPSGVNVGAGASTAASASTGSSSTAPSDTSGSDTTQASNSTGDTGQGSGLKGSKSSNSKNATSTVKPMEEAVDFTYKTFGKLASLPTANTNSLAPAAAGKSLGKLAVQLKDSDNVISGIALGKVARNSQYKVTIEPIGWGAFLTLGEIGVPDSQLNSNGAEIADRLMIKVDSAKPIGSVPADQILTGNKVLAIYDTFRIKKPITKGGTYTAQIQWMSDGYRLRPVLINVQ